MQQTRFPIRIGARSRLLLRVFFGVTPDRAWVAVDDEHVAARLGWWQIELPLSEIEHWRIEGPWRWITAIGVRSTPGSGQISFAGSPRGGVRLDLRRPIRWLIFDVSVFYVGVDDLERFTALLSARGIPGEDGRNGAGALQPPPSAPTTGDEGRSRTNRT